VGRPFCLPQSNLENRSVRVSITCTELSDESINGSNNRQRRDFTDAKKVTILKRRLKLTRKN